MVNFKSYLVALSSIILLSGCEAVFPTKNYVESIFHEEVVFFYTSTNYPKQLQDNTNKKLRQRTLVFGPYMLNIGVIRADRDGHNAYHVGVALGPMRVLKGGLTAKQFEESSISGYDYYGDPVYYRWGELNTLYYITGIFTARELQTEHHLFHEIKGIAITAKQYDKLYERCHTDWVAVKCFMDESFPDLTAVQLEYVKSRKHPSDDDRLAGKFPKPEPDVNHFK
jgi:hypothetical protein